MYPELNKQKAFKKHKQHYYNFPTSQRISKQGYGYLLIQN